MKGLQHLTFLSSNPSKGFSFLAAPGNPLKSSSVLLRLPSMTKPCCRAYWGGTVFMAGGEGLEFSAGFLQNKVPQGTGGPWVSLGY